MKSISLLSNISFMILLENYIDTQPLTNSYLQNIPHQFCYSKKDPNQQKIQSCWNQTCDQTTFSSSCRLESAFKVALNQNINNNVDWFIFTTSNVWWNQIGLEIELKRAEKLLFPSNPKEDVLLIGGGGLMIFSMFMIISKPALILLSDDHFMQQCHHRLRLCDSRISHSGCKFKTMKSSASLSHGHDQDQTQRDINDHYYHSSSSLSTYSANELVHYCLAPSLKIGRCGETIKEKTKKSKGCEWMFGRLVHGDIGDGATAARRRFVSNARQKRPEGFFTSSSSKISTMMRKEKTTRNVNGGYVSDILDQNEAHICAIDQFKDLVAYANTDTAGMMWLDEQLEKYQRYCVD
mmetsp:Transcript_33832/g.43619  ORF Transcript_33832/g.43619 Transcript_33832/m.43619 type:complete len:351 (-) Transcript_33832:151-1203(-)